MSEPSAVPDRFRDRLYLAITRLLAVFLLPVAALYAPRRARHFACQWALAARFPAEDLAGLTPAASTAFAAARTEAFWRDGRLIGVTSGHRDAAEQHRLFADELRLAGSVELARTSVLPPEESQHVRGIAMDVRPSDGARWLEEHGGRYDLYRIYDNEWWHFEHRPGSDGGAPRRLPHPGASPARHPA
ncbi:D,D-peptidase/D,D-carboxypeptidase VanY-N [Amycolatopsis sp. H20-H5]|uniref:D,D-peptidase/D,D-carboxypeptidase VanY-N n=1 Tax=Amycolatopsis sp. H20-H5 TaxID=3046309 RepID=UPI002DBE49D0|nr:D,D-peptidase/D,D-carboxypeptidase VanY-N [Amycolatopsis sp. H20-H5]MEC3982044.1 D,D-peptidase/D,D-carboxypeptidase VanY-N [Amycolatopsis sp. H20-H5]